MKNLILKYKGFLPFIAMLVGAFVAMVGGFDGSNLDWSNGWHLVGAIIVLISSAVVVVWIVIVWVRWIISLTK